jgi:hypothetical protein
MTDLHLMIQTYEIAGCLVDVSIIKDGYYVKVTDYVGNTVNMIFDKVGHFSYFA